MKIRPSILFGILLALVLLVSRADSQQSTPTDSLTALRAIEASNKVLLERQKASLEKLDAMNETARQLRILTRRS